MMYCILKKVTTCMMTHEHMFSQESDDEFLGFESIWLTLVHLICRFDSGGVYLS